MMAELMQPQMGDDKKMVRHIVHIIDSLPIGGAQKLLVTFAHEAQKRSLRTEIICLKSAVDLQVGTDLRACGVSITFFQAKSLLNLVRLWKITRYLRKTKPDVIQTHLTYANIIGGLAGAAAGIPVVATLHSAGKDRRYSKAREKLESWIIRHVVRRVIAVGSNTANSHKPRLGNQKISVVLNAVHEADALTPAERTVIKQEIMADERKTLIISVARFSPVKAFDDLIRAFNIVHQAEAQTMLVLVGDGAMREPWEKLAAELHLTDSVKFLGNRGDVPGLLQASDLFVSSSVVEGMPLAVMEAMSAGLPIIATSVGDLPDMINPACGVLVPPREPQQLADAIITTLSNRQKMKEMGNNARQYAASHFGSAAWMDKLMAIYAEIQND